MTSQDLVFGNETKQEGVVNTREAKAGKTRTVASGEDESKRRAKEIEKYDAKNA